MNEEALRADADPTTAADESAAVADAIEIEEFDLDDIEVIESKVFG